MTTEDHRTAAFRTLALPLLDDLYRLARGLAGSRSAADDLVQECFLRGLRYFDSWHGEDLRAWMAAIMRNIHRDRIGLPNMTDENLEYIADPAPDPEQVAMSDDHAQRLRTLLAHLPEALREVLVLREYGNLSYEQIAQALAIPQGTVMSRLARARERLRAGWLATHGAGP
ncbi:MAG: sigma-70 family RNA polymerase sigma factor [Acidocella sp.]|nr:sigma-70 family RNA polymerase sigma factor [Acidocella sp.]